MDLTDLVASLVVVDTRHVTENVTNQPLSTAVNHVADLPARPAPVTPIIVQVCLSFMKKCNQSIWQLNHDLYTHHFIFFWTLAFYEY